MCGTAAKRVPVLIGTGAEWTDECVRLSREGQEAMGADGVMIIPPFYSTPTDDELFEHYRKVGEAIDVPIMVYNNPATANVDLQARTGCAASRASTTCKYIKESTLEVTRVRDIIELCGDRMTVFAGILELRSRSGSARRAGSRCAQASIQDVGPPVRTRGRRAGSMPAALALYKEMLPIVRWVGGHRYVAASKDGLTMMGLPVGKPRRAPATARRPMPSTCGVKNSTAWACIGSVAA